jgi:hypothetical protein
VTVIPETGRPVSRAELPEGVTCALSADGHLGHEDRWHIARFQRFLTDKAAVMAQYAPRLDAITADRSIAPLRSYPDQAPDDPELVRLWGERARRLRALIREYDADTQPESAS